MKIQAQSGLRGLFARRLGRFCLFRAWLSVSGFWCIHSHLAYRDFSNIREGFRMVFIDCGIANHVVPACKP